MGGGYMSVWAVAVFGVAQGPMVGVYRMYYARVMLGSCTLFACLVWGNPQLHMLMTGAAEVGKWKEAGPRDSHSAGAFELV